MNTIIKMNRIRLAMVLNAGSLMVGQSGAVERLAMNKKLVDAYNKLVGSKESADVPFTREDLAAFRSGIIAGWHVPGRTDAEFFALKDAACSILIWGRVSEKIPKAPEEKDESTIPLDMDPDEEMVLDLEPEGE